MSRRRWVYDHALGLTFTGLWLLFWVGQTWANWAEYAGDSHAHQQAVTAAGFLAFWGGRTLENLQSEMFQLASFVILSAYLLYRGSPESRDSDDRLEAKVDQLLREHNIDPTYFDQAR